MLSIKILDVKQFMHALLLEPTFDHFLLREASVKTGVSYIIDGKLNVDFYDSEEQQQLRQQLYCSYEEQRPFLLSFIRGKKTPLSFKIVFLLAPYQVAKLIEQNHLSYHLEDIQALFLNLHFEHGVLTCTSGTSLNIFTLDKTLDHLWEQTLKAFFKTKQIPFEEL